MQRFFVRKELCTIVSFILFVPQAKTFVMNGKTVGQFNTNALAVNDMYVRFFVTHIVYCDSIVRRMTQEVSLKARTCTNV